MIELIGISGGSALSTLSGTIHIAPGAAVEPCGYCGCTIHCTCRHDFGPCSPELLADISGMEFELAVDELEAASLNLHVARLTGRTPSVHDFYTVVFGGPQLMLALAYLRATRGNAPVLLASEPQPRAAPKRDPEATAAV